MVLLLSQLLAFFSRGWIFGNGKEGGGYLLLAQRKATTEKKTLHTQSAAYFPLASPASKKDRRSTKGIEVRSSPSPKNWNCYWTKSAGFFFAYWIREERRFSTQHILPLGPYLPTYYNSQKLRKKREGRISVQQYEEAETFFVLFREFFPLLSCLLTPFVFLHHRRG